MAEAVMVPLLGRLQELVMKEAQTMAAVDDDVRRLRDKLMWLQAFLRDAEPRRRARNDELTRVCLHQIRGAIFDAEDAVDRYLLRVDLSKYPCWNKVVMFFTEFTTQVRVRADLSRRIGSINRRLESIIENKDKYRIDGQDSSPLTTWRSSTEMNATIENLGRFVLPLVGRDTQRENLKKALTSKTTSPMVITVSGKSGMGKTKLMKAIYEEPLTREHFKVRVWVSFAPDLSASRILKQIRLRMAQVKSARDGGDDHGAALKATLKTSNYLLVLDGEVRRTEWNRILAVLPMGNAKSRVVRITQRNPDEEESPAASFEQENFVLEHFDRDASIELFRRTLRNEKHRRDGAADADDDDPQMKDYLNSIFAVTGGLPLSVVHLAGLLRTKEFPGEWRRVFEHLAGKSSESKRDDIILSMCFDDLPHDLKSCFLYFACFPVNMLVRARSMVCMWMAEGFLSPREGMVMEKVGIHYLNELVHRRLINIPPVEYAVPGFESVTVQSKVHEFLLREAQEASFVEVHSGDDIPTLSTTRRLSLQNHSDKYAALTTPLPKLRSIFSSFEKEDKAAMAAAAAAAAETAAAEMSDNSNIARRVFPCVLPRYDRDAYMYAEPMEIIHRLLQSSKFLRVIRLDGLDIGITLPHEIGSVVHLQYLGITYCSLQIIPPSIGKLTRLQTLDVRGTEVTTLPMEFWKIRTLRHVFGHFALPRRVGHLEYLRNLSSVKPDDDGYWDSRTFAEMIRLNTLRIEEISASNVHSMWAIYKLKYLTILTLDGDVIPSDLFTRSNLPRLQVIRLTGKIEPPLTAGQPLTLPTVTKLVLRNTMVSQSFVDQLADGMPLLSVLVMLEGACDTENLVFKSGFQSITYVTLDLLLTRVEICKPAFRHLVQLEIFVYSADLCVDIAAKPEIKNKIKLDDKYLRGMMMMEPRPEAPRNRFLRTVWKLMDITREARMGHIHTKRTLDLMHHHACG